jgi:hypothetical protein
MSRVRVYLPLTPDQVRHLAAHGSVAVAVAYAVTMRLERAMPSSDKEELEYAALTEAADAAAEALGQVSGPARGRRVVAAADMPAIDERAPSAALPGQLAAVRLTEPVTLRSVVSFHLDDASTDGDEGLLWYDVTELAAVLDLLG